jgi:hypothetical protein
MMSNTLFLDDLLFLYIPTDHSGFGLGGNRCSGHVQLPAFPDAAHRTVICRTLMHCDCADAKAPLPQRKKNPAGATPPAGSYPSGCNY